MNFNISDVSTTKMTSKGQVVIPEEIRNHMHLESGVKFLVMATDDSILFKRIHPPKQDFIALLEASHQLAKEHGVTEADIEEAIIESRKARRLAASVKNSPTRSKVKKTVTKKTSGTKSKGKKKSST